MKTEVKLIKIGQGHFSTAYTTAQLDRCYVKSRCMAKEAYALGFSEESTLYPKVDRVWDLELPLTEAEEDAGFNWYVMPLYKKVTAPSKQLKWNDLAVYKALREMQKGLYYYGVGGRSKYGLDVIRAGFDSLDLDDSIQEQLHCLLDQVCNGIDTKSVRFEISPRNIMLDDCGNMVLIDCFFDSADI